MSLASSTNLNISNNSQIIFYYSENKVTSHVNLFHLEKNYFDLMRRFSFPKKTITFNDALSFIRNLPLAKLELVKFVERRNLDAEKLIAGEIEIPEDFKKDFNEKIMEIVNRAEEELETRIKIMDSKLEKIDIITQKPERFRLEKENICNRLEQYEIYKDLLPKHLVEIYDEKMKKLENLLGKINSEVGNEKTESVDRQKEFAIGLVEQAKKKTTDPFLESKFPRKFLR